MQVRHTSDRRTYITYELGGTMYEATWVQPYEQSWLPDAMLEIIIGCRRGDQEHSFMMDYLAFNYKLQVRPLANGQCETIEEKAGVFDSWAA